MAIKQKKGFTLIELLVVVSIIGILASIMMVGYSNVAQRSRNSKRSADLDALNKAINFYYVQEQGKNNNIKPVPGGAQGCRIGVDANCLTDLVDKGYMDSLPRGPRNRCTASSGPNECYFYYNNNTTAPYYIAVYTQMEPGAFGPFEYGPRCSTGARGVWSGATPNVANAYYCLGFTRQIK